MEYWSTRGMRVRTSLQHSIIHHSSIGLTDVSPMGVKWPVNKQASAYQIFVGNRSPVAAVVAVITVVTQGEIAVPRHGEGLIRFREIFMAERISAIRWPRRHHPLKPVALCFLAVDVKKWRINPQLVARQTGQPFNVKRRTRDRVLANARNPICPKDKNIPVMRLSKVVAEFIHKHLVARVDCTSGDHFATMTKPTRKDIEILTQRLGRGVDQKILPFTNQSRKSKKEGDFPGHNFKNLIVLARDHVDVIATENNELGDLSQNIWRRIGGGMTNDPV